MTDIDVPFLINSGRIYSKMDFNYGSYQQGSSFLHHELIPDENEDDDLDSFYMEMAPVDMVERLKEVNKAHVEDPTPIECDRKTTLRFRDIIAEFQSPRESESDDGYGDSSDIMYDPEEETDNLCDAMKEDTEQIFASHTTSKYTEEQTKKSDFRLKQFTDPGNTATVTNEIIIHEVKNNYSPIRHPAEHKQSPNSTPQCLPKPNLGLENDNSIAETLLQEYEDDFEEDIDDLLNTTDLKVHKASNAKPSYQLEEPKWKKSKNRIKSGNARQPLHRDSNQLKIKEPRSAIIDINKSHIKEQIPYSSSGKVDIRRSKVSDSMTKSTDLTQIYKTKPRPLGLSSSQPIPKSKLIFSPYQLPCSSTTSISMNNISRSSSSKPKSMKRSSLNASVLPTLPNKLKIQSSLSNKQSRPSGPMKAIHNSSIFSNDISAEVLADSRASLEKRLSPMSKGWKSASTTDLHRQNDDIPREISDYAYHSWLQDKKKAASLAKKEKASMRQIKEVDAAVKYSERRQLAEEAFQSWLNKKKEQVHLQRKLKAQQSRLDHQTNYAKTTNQCDDAYKEWYKRKQEEMSLRKTSGTSMRSRSLERTWMQEKTRKLYNAYLPRK